MMRREEEWVAHFETYLLAEKRVSKNTFLSYKHDIEQLCEFLNHKKLTLRRVRLKHLKIFIADLHEQGLSAKSIARKITTVKQFFSFLQKQFGIENKAHTLVMPQQEQKLPVYLTDAEVVRLLEVAGEDTSPRGIRNKVLMYLLYASGMRVSELVSLTSDHIHFDTGFVQLTGKGNKERAIPLPENVLELLRYYCDEIIPRLLPEGVKNSHKFLFFSARKGVVASLTRQMIWHIIKGMLEAARIAKPISPHSLRHSLATHLLKKGTNLRVLQLLLGHENLTTVQIYTHLETSQLRAIYDESHPRAK